MVTSANNPRCIVLTYSSAKNETHRHHIFENILLILHLSTYFCHFVHVEKCADLKQESVVEWGKHNFKSQVKTVLPLVCMLTRLSSHYFASFSPVGVKHVLSTPTQRQLSCFGVRIQLQKCPEFVDLLFCQK